MKPDRQKRRRRTRTGDDTDPYDDCGGVIPSPLILDDGNSAVRVPKKSDIIANELRRRIVRGELLEGSALPSEPELMLRYEVSRPTLREAFRILESEGLITKRGGAKGGTVVRAPNLAVAARYTASILQATGTTADDVYQARLIIEPVAARIGAEQRPPAALRALKAALAVEQSVATDPTSFPAAAAQFHTNVVALSENNTLILLATLVQQITAAHHRLVTRAETPAGGSVRNIGMSAHERLVELIEAGDGDAAEKFWRAHMEKAGSFLRRGAAGAKVIDLQ